LARWNRELARDLLEVAPPGNGCRRFADGEAARQTAATIDDMSLERGRDGSKRSIG
jgi:hypothetical protein